MVSRAKPGPPVIGTHEKGRSLIFGRLRISGGAGGGRKRRPLNAFGDDKRERRREGEGCLPGLTNKI